MLYSNILSDSVVCIAACLFIYFALFSLNDALQVNIGSFCKIYRISALIFSVLHKYDTAF